MLHMRVEAVVMLPVLLLMQLPQIHALHAHRLWSSDRTTGAPFLLEEIPQSGPSAFIWRNRVFEFPEALAPKKLAKPTFWT
jgi:hypothetical protein